jgi:hypothetical protein
LDTDMNLHPNQHPQVSDGCPLRLFKAFRNLVTVVALLGFPSGLGMSSRSATRRGQEVESTP